MTHAQNRALREEYFTAWINRASDRGPQAEKLDNDPVLSVLVALRHEKAQLLGFENFVELRLANRMATSPAQVSAFIRQQIVLNTPHLLRDTQGLKAFALTLGYADIQPWDEEFLAEQLRLQQLNGALKGLRQYFPLDDTLRRLCRFSEHLFGITIVEQTALSHWHDSVRLLEISEHGQVIGHIYVDPFHREDATDLRSPPRYAFAVSMPKGDQRCRSLALIAISRLPPKRTRACSPTKICGCCSTSSAIVCSMC